MLLETQTISCAFAFPIQTYAKTVTHFRTSTFKNVNVLIIPIILSGNETHCLTTIHFSAAHICNSLFEVPHARTLAAEKQHVE